MKEYEQKILELLGRALPQMSETRKAWLLGLVEGIAGEPGRTDNRKLYADSRQSGAAVRPGA